MSAPLPVVVVSDSSRLTVFIGGILSTALRAWILMVLAPVVLPWHPSYWQAVAAVYVVATLTGDAGWVWWTRSPRGAR